MISWHLNSLSELGTFEYFLKYISMGFSSLAVAKAPIEEIARTTTLPHKYKKYSL